MENVSLSSHIDVQTLDISSKRVNVRQLGKNRLSRLSRFFVVGGVYNRSNKRAEGLALASMALDDPPARSTAPASRTAAAMRGKVGSEFET